MSNPRVGSRVKGRVVYVDDNCAYVDVNAKMEGKIYLDHFTSKYKEVKSLKDLVKVDDVITAEITKNSDSDILLSRLGIEEKEKRDRIIRKIMNRHPFEADVKKHKEDGFILVKDDVQLFLPDRYADLSQEFDPQSIVGTTQKVQFVKSELDEKGRTTFVVSRKQVQYNEAKKAREKELDKINEGDTLSGEVVRLTDFGAFVRFSYAEGLVHLSEISHYHIKSADEILNVGDTVQVKVLKKGETKLQLSIKALQKTPWELFTESHKVGEVIETTIVKKSDNYMLCEVERDVVGILNKADYSWNEKDDSLQGSVSEGDKLSLQITYLDKEKNKMTLSKKHLEYNPWQDVHFRSHEIVTGTVIRFTNTGAIVQVGNVEGFLSNKEASETNKSASEVLKEGEVISAEVLRVDPKSWFLSLSIKSVEEKKNREYVDKYIEENVSSSYTLADVLKESEKGQK